MVVLCVLVLAPGKELPIDSGDGRFARFSLRMNNGTIAIGRVAELPKVK